MFVKNLNRIRIIQLGVLKSHSITHSLTQARTHSKNYEHKNKLENFSFEIKL